jgi:hypothetical protein
MEMMRRKLLPLMAGLILLSGCATMDDPRAELLIAQRSFIAVVNSLSDLKDTETIDGDDVITITSLIHAGDEVLDDWTALIIEEKRSPRVIETFHYILEKLIDYRKRGD